MNPIVAPKAGKIAQILIGDAQPVEFDQPLVVIE
jgi:acetyl-CoA carboxylase biotin carboxyl carrier protein